MLQRLPRLYRTVAAGLIVFALVDGAVVGWGDYSLQYRTSPELNWTHPNSQYNKFADAWSFVRNEIPRGQILAYTNFYLVLPLMGAVAGRLSRTVVMPGFPAALWREVGRHDVVHLHSPMAEAGLVALACRLTGTPLVITHQGDVVMPDGVVNQLVQRGMVAMLANRDPSAA